MKTIVQLVSELKTYFTEKDTASRQAVEANIAPVETDATSSAAAYSIGDQLNLNDILYKATAAIAIGDALAVGTNIAFADDIVTQLGDAASRIGTVTTQTLAAQATSVSFTVPTTGNHLIDFWSSDGSNYTAIDTSVSGTATLTYDASESARTISCRISEV